VIYALVESDLRNAGSIEYESLNEQDKTDEQSRRKKEKEK